MAATDEDDLAMDQTDLGLFSACAVVEKIYSLKKYTCYMQ